MFKKLNLTGLPVFEIANAAYANLKDKLSSLHPPSAVPRIIPQPRESGYVTSFDGTEIYWEVHGPVESLHNPIVFCYGLVCSMNQWRAQLDRYSKDRPCLLLDYRGHHRSRAPNDPRLFNISAIAKDVAAAVRNQNFTKPAHIFGHSMGCNVAIELAASEPELVASMVLCCGTMKNPFHGMFGANGLEKLIDPILREYPKHSEIYHLIWRLALAKPDLAKAVTGIVGFNEKASRPEDTDAYIKAVASINPNVFFPILIDFSKGMTEAIVPRVHRPSLVVAGGQDHVTPPAAQKAMAEALPGATYMEVPTGSHNVQLDFGEYVCLKAEEFWKEHSLS